MAFVRKKPTKKMLPTNNQTQQKKTVETKSRKAAYTIPCLYGRDVDSKLLAGCGLHLDYLPVRMNENFAIPVYTRMAYSP